MPIVFFVSTGFAGDDNMLAMIFNGFPAEAICRMVAVRVVRVLSVQSCASVSRVIPGYVSHWCSGVICRTCNTYSDGGSWVAWFRNRHATILTPSVAHRFKLFGIAFGPSTFACSSRTVVIIAVIAVAICSALYSRSKEASLSKFVRNEM